MPTLKDLREDAALTMGELAGLVGVNVQTIWRWENARARPSPPHRRKLASVFGKETKDIAEAVRETSKERPAA